MKIVKLKFLTICVQKVKILRVLTLFIKVAFGCEHAENLMPLKENL
jgi:hypothetical protein